MVNRIDRCVMVLDNEGELTDSLTVTGTPTLLDKNGAAVTSEYLSVEPGDVEVTVPVYRTKKLTLEPQFVNVPKGFPWISSGTPCPRTPLWWRRPTTSWTIRIP